MPDVCSEGSVRPHVPSGTRLVLQALGAVLSRLRECSSAAKACCLSLWWAGLLVITVGQAKEREGGFRAHWYSCMQLGSCLGCGAVCLSCAWACRDGSLESEGVGAVSMKQGACYTSDVMGLAPATAELASWAALA